MRIVYKTICFFFLVLFFTANGICINIDNIEFPVVDGGYKVNRGHNDSINAKTLNYKVDILFPATEVVEFYDNKLKKQGLVPYEGDGYGSRQWENFNSSKGSWQQTNNVPARYISSWVDKNKSIRVILILRYKYYNYEHKNWENTLLVDIKAVPYFKFRNSGDIHDK